MGPAAGGVPEELGGGMDHSLFTWTDLFGDSFDDRDGCAGCSPFPECMGAPCDDTVTDFFHADSGLRDYDTR